MTGPDNHANQSQITFAKQGCAINALAWNRSEVSVSPIWTSWLKSRTLTLCDTDWLFYLIVLLESVQWTREDSFHDRSVFIWIFNYLPAGSIIHLNSSSVPSSWSRTRTEQTANPVQFSIQVLLQAHYVNRHNRSQSHSSDILFPTNFSLLEDKFTFSLKINTIFLNSMYFVICGIRNQTREPCKSIN